MNEVDFNKATQLKEKLDTFRPLTKLEAEKLRASERIDEVYSSNFLEGNTLTRYETKMILETGITVGEKPFKDYLEAVNLNRASEFVEDLVSGDEPLTEYSIKQIHYLVLQNIYDDNQDAGRYRAGNVEISGSRHIPPNAFRVQEEMDNLMAWNEENKDKLHPIEYSALLHQKFVSIHPFTDGNGRTARLLMNFALTSKGYPPIIIKPDLDSRRRYNKALEHTDLTGDPTDFVNIVKRYAEEKLEKMVTLLSDREIVEKKNEPSKEEKNKLEELAKRYKYINRDRER